MRIDELLMRIPLSAELQAAQDAVQGPAWVVGGTVRDLLLGRTPVDVDVATQHPEPLARRFAASVGGTLVPMDEERGIWRVAARNVTQYDFCRFRDRDIIGDLAGRDFTFNAIAVRMPEHDHGGGLIDPFHGVDDLNAGLLRMVSPRAFQDDPLRVLRAFRFFSELPLTFDDDTWRALQDAGPALRLMAAERIQVEWWKLCGGRRAAEALRQMDEGQVLPVIFPELEEAKGVGQNVYHHLDVWEHLLLTTTLMSRFLWHPEEVFQDLQPAFAPVLDDPHRRARLVFLAMIHDIGKPETWSETDGKVHFYGHEIAGAAMAEGICLRLRLSHEDTRAITTVIRHHLRPLFMMQSLARGELSPKAMMKFFDEVGAYALDVMALALADKSASRGPAAKPDVQDRLRDLYRDLLTFYETAYLPARREPLITGDDLVQGLHMAPGPAVGDLLARAREQQVLGRLSTREEALRWARTRARTR